MKEIRTAVLASGAGSNFKALVKGTPAREGSTSSLRTGPMPGRLYLLMNWA